MSDPKSRRAAGRWRLLTFLLLFVALALLVAVIVVAVKLNSKQEVETCGTPSASKVGNIDRTESENPSVFRDLTSKEISGLMTFLHSRKELNLVKAASLKVNTSYVYLSDLHLPNKNDVLNFLDNGGGQPPREARVVIFRGDKTSPDVEEYIVGPLPNPTTIRPLQYKTTPIPFIFRPITGPEHLGVLTMVTEQADKALGSMLEELYGGKLINCGDKCLVIRYVTPVAPVLSGEQTRKTWYWFSQFADYFILHPLDLAILVNQETADFRIEQIWFNGELYNTFTDVLNFYNANKNSIERKPFPKSDSNLFSSMNQRGTPPLDPPLRNPVQVSPDGKRYNVKDRHVKYMDWTFDFRMSPIRGPQLYNINFRRERIVYELSLQEISVFYAGSKPMQALANYMDSIGLIGIQAKGLVPGVDCPSDSTFFDSKFQVESDDAFALQNAFCLFEYNSGLPLRRHHSYSFAYGRFYEGMENTVLILRTMAVIINYDYIVDYIFYPNGAIQVKIVSTGYVLANFYTTNEEKYSFKLHEHLAANIHHHLFHFKADLDIKGTSNRFATANVEYENIPNKFSKDPNGRIVQQKFSTTLKTTEKDAAYKFNFETPKYLIVYNEEDKSATNYTGSKGYRIINNGMAKQILPEGLGNEPSITWARYQVAISQYKDTERHSSSIYSLLDSQSPAVHFQDFLEDDESVVDKDLVSWITMGVHHIPHTEDLPVTPTPGMELTFYLSPYNYFTEDPAMASLNAVRIEPEDNLQLKTSVRVNRYGVKQGLQCVPEENKYDEEIRDNPSIVLDTGGGGFL